MSEIDYAGVGDDDRGIYLHPAEWNCKRLPDSEETLLAYFFKLMYMERVRQVKRWGDQRHPDGTSPRLAPKGQCQRPSNDGEVTWMDILLEEIGETAECPPVVSEEQVTLTTTPNLEVEMVQSAAVLAAWHSDVCRRVEEIMRADKRAQELKLLMTETPLITREELGESFDRSENHGIEPLDRHLHPQHLLGRAQESLDEGMRGM